MERYKRLFLVGISLIALGVTFTTTMENNKSPGTVFIALGGLFMIGAMRRKRDKDQS